MLIHNSSHYDRIVSDLVLVPVLIGYYTYDAYNRAGWLGPTAMYAYFLISTVVNKVLMGPAVRLTVKMERKEGDFRFKHMELRTHSESLALSGSEKTELQNVNEKLSNLCKVQKSLYDRNLPIDLSVNLFNYFGAILSYVVIAVPIFSGVYDNLDSGDLTEMISNTAFVCMYLVFQLTQLVNITSSMAGLAGSTHRLKLRLLLYDKYKYQSRIVFFPHFVGVIKSKEFDINLIFAQSHRATGTVKFH